MVHHCRGFKSVQKLNVLCFHLKHEAFVELWIARPLAELGLHLSTSVRQQTNSIHSIIIDTRMCGKTSFMAARSVAVNSGPIICRL